MDPAGQLVNEFSRKGDGPKALEPQPGMNRFLWDMRYAAPPGLPDESGQSPAAPAFTGPLAVPGTYRVRLTVGEEVYEESFELLNDPSSAATQADLEEQLGLELRIRDKYREAQEFTERVRGVRRQVEEWERRAQGQADQTRVSDASAGLQDKLSAIENEIVPFKPTPEGPPRGLPMGYMES